MSNDTEQPKTRLTAWERLESLLAMPEVAVWRGVMVPPDLARDFLRERDAGVAQSVTEMLHAGMSVSEIKVRMVDGRVPPSPVRGGAQQ